MIAPGINIEEIREARASIMFLEYRNSRKRSLDRGQTQRSAPKGQRLLALKGEYLNG
jgi:hypothetical protein